MSELRKREQFKKRLSDLFDNGYWDRSNKVVLDFQEKLAMRYRDGEFDETILEDLKLKEKEIGPAQGLEEFAGRVFGVGADDFRTSILDVKKVLDGPPVRLLKDGGSLRIEAGAEVEVRREHWDPLGFRVPAQSGRVDYEAELPTYYGDHESGESQEYSSFHIERILKLLKINKYETITLAFRPGAPLRISHGSQLGGGLDFYLAPGAGA